MKLKFWNIIFIAIIMFSCQNEQKRDGYYAICYNGKYTEVYFKKNSMMRVASENELRTLSEWEKIEIKKDTLYFKSFDEWKHKWKAKIYYLRDNDIELHNLNTDMKFSLEQIHESLDFENLKEFWNGFSNRQKIRNCK
ncbi:hypothetical protein [Aurantibacter sp.]|uniref:hypothetical protein n=1 Tax=Aurantibacter sp. TaxID=2807103 RepID=UPI0035C8768D